MGDLRLSALNLNLLVHLDAILEEESVTRAAQRERVTQSAMSHSLQKLRDLLGDALLVRQGRGTELTPAALALRAPLRKVLLDLQRVVEQRGRFDPATAERLFACACPDFLSVVIMPHVAARLAKKAPRIDVELLPTQRPRYPVLLESGELDFALGAVLAPAPGLRRMKLYTESFTCVARKDHPRLKKALTLEAFARLDHCLITIGESTGPTWVDDQLRLRGLRRRIVVRTRSFLAAPQIVAATDLVMTGPRRLCEQMAKHHALKVFDPPFELPAYDEELLWHERLDDDPAHEWMRNLFADVAAHVSSVRR